jgi:hypothetical protein
MGARQRIGGAFLVLVVDAVAFGGLRLVSNRRNLAASAIS